jgi:hypothetical protein
VSRAHAESPGFTFDSFAWPSAVTFYSTWLRLGALTMLLLPDARASHWLLGWMPFWLLVVPALALLQQRLMRGGTQARSAANSSP